MNEQTFIILKPDAISRGLIGKIISRFERKDFKIIRMEQHWKNSTWCERHYKLLAIEVYMRLREFMISDPIIGIILEGPNIIYAARNMIGSTNSSEAALGTIRGDYGSGPVHYNLVHASDSE